MMMAPRYARYFRCIIWLISNKRTKWLRERGRLSRSQRGCWRKPLDPILRQLFFFALRGGLTGTGSGQSGKVSSAVCTAIVPIYIKLTCCPPCAGRSSNYCLYAHGFNDKARAMYDIQGVVKQLVAGLVDPVNICFKEAIVVVHARTLEFIQ